VGSKKCLPAQSSLPSPTYLHNNPNTREHLWKDRNNLSLLELLMTALIYLTVKQFSEKHPAFTNGGLRSLIFNEESNGLAKAGAIVRIGRRVLIDEEKFFSWVKAQNSSK
jgi:hypothetical protein